MAMGVLKEAQYAWLQLDAIKAGVVTISSTRRIFEFQDAFLQYKTNYESKLAR